MGVRKSKTLAVAVAMGAAIGAGGATSAAAAPGVTSAPRADGCWCGLDLSNIAFNDFAFSDWSFGDWLFARSALAGRTPFGLRFTNLPRGFSSGVPRGHGRQPGGQQFGAPGGQYGGQPGGQQFGAPGGQYGGQPGGQEVGAPSGRDPVAP